MMMVVEIVVEMVVGMVVIIALGSHRYSDQAHDVKARHTAA